MLRNRIKEAMEAGDMAVGTWVEMNNPEACEAAAAAGFDFVVIDGEHGSFGIESSVQMIRAIEAGGATPVLRLPDSSPVAIQKALEAGTPVVFISEVRTGEEALQIVQATKYAPAGRRGASPFVRCTMHGVIDWEVYTEWIKKNIMVWMMIENADAVRNIDSILSSGVDAIFVGPYDLSMSMGLEGDYLHPDVVEAQDRVVQLALKKGVEVVVNLDLAIMDKAGFKDQETCDKIADLSVDDIYETAMLWKKKGCRIVTAQTDRQLLCNFYRKIMGKFRAH